MARQAIARCARHAKVMEDLPRAQAGAITLLLADHADRGLRAESLDWGQERGAAVLACAEDHCDGLQAAASTVHRGH